MKKLFKRVANQLKGLSESLQNQLNHETNINVLKACLLDEDFRSVMIEKAESGKLLEMLIQGRMQYKNLANTFIYFNGLVNGIFKPEIITEGFWTKKV